MQNVDKECKKYSNFYMNEHSVSSVFNSNRGSNFCKNEVCCMVPGSYLTCPPAVICSIYIFYQLITRKSNCS